MTLLSSRFPRVAMRGIRALAGAALALGVWQGASAQTMTTVRYEEVVRSVLYTPMYVALQKGFFKDAGIDIRMKTSQGADKGMAALLSGSADIVLLGPEASIYVAGSESPVKPRIFAGLTATDGFMLVSRTPVKNFDWNSLRGKTILSFRPGSTPDVFLEAALRKHGLDPRKDVKLMNNIGPAARVGAWLAGQADYAEFLEPEVGTLETQKKAYVLASVGQEVGPVDYTAFTTTDAYIQKNPQIVQTWTNVIAKTQKYVETAPAEELAQTIAPFFTGVSKPELVKAINRYRTYHIWKSTPLVRPSAIQAMQDMLVTSGVLKPTARVTYQQVVDPSFATKVPQ